MWIPILKDHRYDSPESIVGKVGLRDGRFIVTMREGCALSMEQLGTIFGRFGAIVTKMLGDGSIQEFEIKEFSAPSEFFKKQDDQKGTSETRSSHCEASGESSLPLQG